MNDARFEKLCKIAKISIHDKEGFQKTLSSIGEWISKIDELNLDTKDANKTLSLATTIDCLPTMSKEINVFRLDTTQNSGLEQDSLFKNAPDHDSNYFRVVSYM